MGAVAWMMTHGQPRFMPVVMIYLERYFDVPVLSDVQKRIW